MLLVSKAIREEEEYAAMQRDEQDAFEEMYQALLDAPLPLDQTTLYADWYRMVRRPAVKAAGRVRKARG